MEKFDEIIEETKVFVREQIMNRDNRPNYMSEKQLYSILDELEKMDQIRNKDLFFPYYPKGIEDSWNYSEPLADKLLKLLEVYCKL